MAVQAEFGRPGKLSYLSPARHDPLLTLTVGELLDRAAEKYALQPGLIVAGQLELNFSEIRKRTREIASGLADLGLIKGDLVIICSQNSAELYLIVLACAYLGFPFLMCEVWTSEFLLELLQDRKPVCLFLGDDAKVENCPYVLATRVIPEIGSGLANRKIHTNVVKSLSVIITASVFAKSGAFTLAEVRRRGQIKIVNLFELTEQVQQEDICLIFLSSGSTGKPKASTRTHQTLVNGAHFLGKEYAFSSQDKASILNFSPPYFSLVLMPALAFGSAVVLLDSSYPSSIVDGIISEKLTYLMGASSILQKILDDVEQRNVHLGSLRIVMATGTPSPRLMSDIKLKFPVPFVGKTYGMSEVGVIFYSLMADPDDLRVSTIGFPSPLVEIKLIGTDGRTVNVGSAGELCIRGFPAISGPYNPLPLDNTHWCHTGDLMVMLESGHCRYLGRCEEFIYIGTSRVIPIEVEKYLSQHPKIKQTFVFGLGRKGCPLEVAVWIELNDEVVIAKEDIVEFCKLGLLAEMVPSHIHFTDSLPLTHRGKINRKLVEEKSMELFGLK